MTDVINKNILKIQRQNIWWNKGKKPKSEDTYIQCVYTTLQIFRCAMEISQMSLVLVLFLQGLLQ